MTKIIILTIIIFAFGSVMQILYERKQAKVPESSYKRKQYFFSIAERKFYEVLKEVAQELNMELFSKVRLADIIYCDSKREVWLRDWNKIKSKHVDFLLCDKENYTPKIAIELDDSSHSRKNIAKRDEVKTMALELADLGLLRLKVEQSYSKETIARILKKKEEVENS